MDHRDKNIFYGLVTNENSVTELFCNLFQFKPFKTAILELFLERGIIDRIQFDDCNTQKHLDDCGCPDLIISNDDVEIIFEVKIGNTYLTENQPKGYLKHFDKLDIAPKKHKWLIFLIPDDYCYREAWGKGMPIEIKKEDWQKRIPLALPNSGVKTHKIYWSQIIRQIEDYDLPAMNPYLNDFVILLKKRFEREPIIFTYSEVKRMFTDEIPRVVKQLRKIVDYTREDLISVFGDEVTIGRIYSSDEEYAVHIDDQQFINFWFGMWYPYWEKYKIPLWYGIKTGSEPKIVNAFKQSHDQKLVYEDGWYYTWIEEILFDDLNSQKNVSSLIIKEIKALLSIIES